MLGKITSVVCVKFSFLQAFDTFDHKCTYVTVNKLIWWKTSIQYPYPYNHSYGGLIPGVVIKEVVMGVKAYLRKSHY